ncbi:hypothetical protein Slin15195_G122250 [Septoria linicola]|uniref:Uncharacterized protein n=1 Tax=Septoria linicola TaxID=215465 RepID=A0A9Q9EPM0_9PEZI|nr:hypothetical protein Slin14017_G078450 [Septoria linicola]USW58906.1 hypothetical protein Slin15195_G122250 [Septoria linicola]
MTPPAITLEKLNSLAVSATLSSSHPTPITIYTRLTIFNPREAQNYDNFVCTDLSDHGTVTNIQTGKRKVILRPISLERGSQDAPLLYTLHPGQPVAFTAPFYLGARGDRTPLEKGHRYRLGISERERVRKWVSGTRDEVLVEPGEQPHVEWQRGVELDVGAELEFDVLAGP